MADIIHWPYDLLVPERTRVSSSPFSRGGGRSLGGLQRTVRTDRGFWRIRLENIWPRTVEMRRTWGAIDTALGGTSGLIAIPAWSHDVAPYADPACGSAPRPVETEHDDDAFFDDDEPYVQGNVVLEMATFAPIGATVATIRIIAGAAEPSGIRFSYQHALNRTGRILEQVGGNSWRVELATAIRAPIPAGSLLEADRPTCLCHLVNDDGMALDFSGLSAQDLASVEFVEATDYWVDLAMGLVD